MSWKGRWLSLRARISMASVVILIADGTLKCIRGNVPPSLLKDFDEVATARGITDALITVSGSHDSRTFDFSSDIDDSTRQRLRNVWYAYPERKMTRV